MQIFFFFISRTMLNNTPQLITAVKGAKTKKKKRILSRGRWLLRKIWYLTRNVPCLFLQPIIKQSEYEIRLFCFPGTKTNKETIMDSHSVDSLALGARAFYLAPVMARAKEHTDRYPCQEIKVVLPTCTHMYLPRQQSMSTVQ